MVNLEIKNILIVSEQDQETVAKYLYNEWELLENAWGNTSYKDLIKNWHTRSINSCFVAYIGDQIVGSVSIVDNDMPGLDLGFTPGPLPPGPWLSTLFVVPEFRRQGIATFLITYCKDYLSSMGYTEAYLFAEKPGLEYSLYGPLGWEIIKRVDYKHYKDLAVMKIKI